MVNQVLHEMQPLLQQRPDFHVAINLAGDDLVDDCLNITLQKLLEETRIKPTNIVCEITERVFMDAQKTQTQLKHMRATGMQVAIDDFGTGYSSLSYLMQTDIDILKIDKVFVSAIGTQSVTANVINHIISLAQSLDLQMIAEGVETPEQALWLKQHGVQLAQGWHYAKPMPFEQLRRNLG